MRITDEVMAVIQRQLSESLHETVCVTGLIPVSGGDICDSFRVETDTRSVVYFAKCCNAAQAGILEAEFGNLHMLHQAAEIHTPTPIAQMVNGGIAVLLLSYLSLDGPEHEFELGQRLSALHRHTSKQYGLDFDNFIGLTGQRNHRSPSWLDFWWECRLYPQLQLAGEHGFAPPLAGLQEPLKEACRRLLESHQPPASLLHGDLWSGNKGYLTDGTPVIFDPACYYGDRETDIAFTEVFGGFSPEFYRGYQLAWPLDNGYQQRKALYNLYHLLNHLNMFGRSYLPSCLRQIQLLLNQGPE